jgi:hypothetical protein
MAVSNGHEVRPGRKGTGGGCGGGIKNVAKPSCEPTSMDYNSFIDLNMRFSYSSRQLSSPPAPSIICITKSKF